MFFHMPTGGPGNGLRPPQITVPVYARAAFEKGDIVMFDLANSDAAVNDNNLDGGADSGFANVINPAVAQEGYGLFAVALEAIADNAESEVMIYGVADAFVHTATTAGSAAKYDELILDVSVEVNALTFDAHSNTTAHVDSKVLGIALAVVTTPTTPTLGSVFFNGITGFGTKATDLIS